MQVQIRHRPAFATIFLTLAPGESVIAVADAMASMSGHIRARARFFGGLWVALLRRLFGGASLFMSQFACTQDGRPGEVVLSQATCGDIEQIELHDTTLYVRPGAFIACGPSVKLGIGWAGWASWFGGEGLFRLKVSGSGLVWLGAYGSIVKRSVTSHFAINTGHLLAYDPTVSLHVSLPGSIFSSLLGGEGFVTQLRGPGTCYLQSRSVESLVDWTNKHLS